MLARDALGLFSDIDDTLTDARSRWSPRPMSRYAAARAAGLRVVLVTGRPIGWAEVLAQIFPVDAAIAENGAVAALPGGERVYFDSDAERRDGERRRAVAAERATREVPEIPCAIDQRQRAVDLAFDIAETARAPEAAIVRLEAILHACQLRTARSSIHLHGSYSHADKATMSVRIAARLWAEPEAVLRALLLRRRLAERCAGIFVLPALDRRRERE